jgi:glycerol uptake facilitator-like aquaporin
MMQRRLAAEALGTGFLLMAVVGSGIMAETLFAAQPGGALLANALATGFALFALITVFGPLSGAHFNPVVTLVMALRGQIGRGDAVAYALAQIAGAVLGVWVAHGMFDQPVLQVSAHARDGGALFLSEIVATFGLVLTILGAPRGKEAALVASYIAAAYWFTASTSFANPAAAIARALTGSFAGIAPASVPAFLLAEVIGAVLALAVGRWLFAPQSADG